MYSNSNKSGLKKRAIGRFLTKLCNEQSKNNIKIMNGKHTESIC